MKTFQQNLLLLNLVIIGLFSIQAQADSKTAEESLNSDVGPTNPTKSNRYSGVYSPTAGRPKAKKATLSQPGKLMAVPSATPSQR